MCMSCANRIKESGFGLVGVCQVAEIWSLVILGRFEYVYTARVVRFVVMFVDLNSLNLRYGKCI